MASKKKKEVPIVYTNGDRKLFLHPTFVYEIEVFVCGNGRYHLFDTLNVSLKNFKEEKRYSTQVDGKTIIQNYTLLAAPLDWLQRAKFILYDQS